MSREAAALGTTVHQSRHDTGLSDVQLGHYARGPISGRSMADETARKRAKTAVAAWWSRWDEYRVWRAPCLTSNESLNVLLWLQKGRRKEN